jgi:hypothetical protein
MPLQRDKYVFIHLGFVIFEKFFMKLSNIFLSFSCIIGLVCAISPNAFAGGGDSTGSGSTNPTTSPSPITSPTLINPTINQLNPLQSSFSQTTSYFNGTSQSCGFALNGGIGNTNTIQQTVYQVGFSYNSQPCSNPNKLEKLRQEEDTKRVKLQTQGSIVINCMREKTNALSLKQNPDSVCKIPDLSEINSLLH